MTDSITYRTTDPTRWGTGQNAELSYAQVDINFWVLYQLYTFLQESLSHGGLNQIQGFSVTGNQLRVILNSGQIFGPYILPTAEWNPTGAWVANQPYNINDTFYQGTTAYLNIYPNPGQETFDPNANDGLGHQYFVPVLKANVTRNLPLFVNGQPGASELLLQYVTPEAFILPAGLPASVAVQGTLTNTVVDYTLYKNGVFIGSVDFIPSPPSIAFYFPATVTFLSGDVFSILGPAHPDVAQANVSITIVATLA
jgi:hypothetical protein